MIKILYIVSTLKRTGPINILYDIIKYLDPLEQQPHILTLRSEPSNSRIKEFEALGVKIDSLHEDGKILTPVMIHRFRKFVYKTKPDVVHSMGFRPDLLSGFFLQNYVRISSQLNYPFDDFPMTYGAFVGGAMARLTTLAIKRMTVVVACSEDVADKLKRKGLTLPVICNAIDLALFESPTPLQKALAREKLNIPVDAKAVFIFVGVLTERKQPLVAIEAFNKFCDTFANAYLIILGDGDQRGECEKASLPHADHFRFMGNVTDTRPFLTAADYYLATSKAEGMPVSVLEALALRLPIILSDINPHKEIISFNKSAGLLVKTGSEADTVNKMFKIVSADRQSMEDAALSIVSDHLNAKSMSTKFQDLYKTSRL
jgi:glycosyltransferase involved in cell wall biosynthesis